MEKPEWIRAADCQPGQCGRFYVIGDQQNLFVATFMSQENRWIPDGKHKGPVVWWSKGTNPQA